MFPSTEQQYLSGKLNSITRKSTTLKINDHPHVLKVLQIKALIVELISHKVLSDIFDHYLIK